MMRKPWLNCFLIVAALWSNFEALDGIVSQPGGNIVKIMMFAKIELIDHNPQSNAEGTGVKKWKHTLE